MGEVRGSETLVRIPVAGLQLDGILSLPVAARGIVVFAHGSGSSRLSPRNARVASVLTDAGFGTLLFDLLTEQEDAFYQNRFDISRLAERLVGATDWLRETETGEMPVGFFGASTGAAAALVAAAEIGPTVRAVVSRGGRPDLAGDALRRVRAPVLLIVGGNDPVVIRMNTEALELIDAPKELRIVEGATHLFEERGALEEVSRLAAGWFDKHLAAPGETAEDR